MGNLSNIFSLNPSTSFQGLSALGMGMNTTPANNSNFSSSNLGNDAFGNPISQGSLLGNAQNFLNGITNGNSAATAATNASTSTTAANSASTSFLSDIFLRGVVIITGFIFLAVGLSMFKSSGGNSTTVIKTVGKIAKAAVV